MKKTIQKLLVVFFLILIYSYVLTIENIPEQLILFEGENITIRTLLGLNIKSESGETIETVSNSKNTNQKAEKTTMQLSLFEHINLKKVKVDVIPKAKVIPVGSIAGVKLYTSGVLVVGMSEIQGMDNKIYRPYENTGIKEGDTITKINEITIDSTEELIQTVNRAKGKAVKIKYVQGEETKECSIEPVKTSENEYKLGLWVRDSAARSRDGNVL